jgi:hypothetical protein
MQDRRAYVKWKEVFLVGHNDLANDKNVKVSSERMEAVDENHS